MITFDTFVDLLINITEAFIYLWFIHKKVVVERNILKFLAALIIMTTTLSCFQYFSVSSIILVALMVIYTFIYALTYSRSRIFNKLFFSFLIVLLSGLIDVLVALSLSFITHVPFEELVVTNAFRWQAALLSKASLILIAFFLTRNKADNEVIKGTIWILLYSIPVICIGILFTELYFQVVLPGSSQSFYVLSIGLTVICFASIAIYDRLADFTRRLLNQEMLISHMQSQNTYMDEIKNYDEELRRFRHDYANHLQVINGLIDDGHYQELSEYINDINALDEKKSIMINSSNSSINAIVGSKVSRALRMGVQVDYNISLPNNVHIPSMDLCSILGNVLDNALEATKHLAESESRKIELYIAEQAGNIIISAKNRFDGRINLQGRKIQSTKSSPGHGIGLVSVRAIVSKYDGIIDIDFTNNYFQVRILLPNNPIPLTQK